MFLHRVNNIEQYKAEYVHCSDKPGEPGKPGDMINILKSGRKFQKFFKSWRSQGGFFDKADKPIFRLFLLKPKSKLVVLCFLHDRFIIYI